MGDPCNICGKRRNDLDEKDQYISLILGQLNSLQDQISSLMEIIREQNRQIISDDHHKSLLLDENAQLKSQVSGLGEQLLLSQQLLDAMKKIAEADKNTIAKKNKQLQKTQGLRYGKKLMADMLFGRKSEKSHEHAVAPDLDALDLSAEERLEALRMFSQHGQVKLVKSAIPDIDQQGLPVKVIHVKRDDVPPGTRIIGQKTTKLLVYHKAWTEVHEIVRDIYISDLDNNFKQKSLTPKVAARPFKCKADISVIVQLLMDKYLYHSPLSRQLSKFEQAGVRLPYSTVNDWSGYGCRALKPLYELLIREAIKGGILHCDETGMLVIDKSKPLGKKSHRGQMWVMVNPLQRFVCFKYAKGRGHKDIEQILQGFTGFLHTDGYTTYNKFGNQKGVMHGKCLVHARRYFRNARLTHPGTAFLVLRRFINPLYAIERRCRADGLDFDQITEMRQRFSVPILQAFHKWLLKHKPKAKASNPMQKAIEYILKIWDGIMLYTTDGMLSPDNNIAEQQIRALALGRNNWMFAGSHDAAPNAAIMYSFFGTCKMQGIDPGKWLTDVLKRIATQPADKLADLLPQNWKNGKIAA